MKRVTQSKNEYRKEVRIIRDLLLQSKNCKNLRQPNSRLYINEAAIRLQQLPMTREVIIIAEHIDSLHGV